MSNRLTPAQLDAAAVAAGFEPRAVRAVLQVETGGSGYDAKTGYLLIQFEPSWFRRLLPKANLLLIEAARLARNAKTATKEQLQVIADWEFTQANEVESQVPERLAFDAASRLHRPTAQLATSWGIPQLMGFNFAAAGYRNIEEMVESFRQSEANQVAGMLRWIKSNPKLTSALKRREWGVVAYFYNGSAYAQHGYHLKLAKAYASLS